MAKNKGRFIVVLNKETGKYVINYIEKGIMISLDDYNFDKTEEADQYIKEHKEELDEFVTNFLEEDKKKKAKEEEEKRQKEEEEANAKKEKEAKRVGFWYGFRRFIAGVLAAVIALVGGHFAAKKIASSNRDDIPTHSVDNSSTPDNSDVSNNYINNITQYDEAYTEENITNLIAEFSKKYTDKNISVSTEDLAKFVIVANIDKLVEENPELASEIFASQPKEEFLSDAAKVIGMTYSYNVKVWQEERKHDNFILISDSIQDPEQKQAIKNVESYVLDIAGICSVINGIEEEMSKVDSSNVSEIQSLKASKEEYIKKANELIAELLYKMGDPNSSMSYLDNGVGFVNQVYIELLRSCLAKDVINKENLDWLSILTSSEEYVSNIFTIYDGCTKGITYTRTRK